MSTNRVSFFQNQKHVGIIIVIAAIVLLLIIAVPLLIVYAAGRNANNTPSSARTGLQSFQVGAGAVLSLKEQGGNISVYPGKTNVITVEPRNPGTTIIPSASAVHILYTETHDAQGHEHLTVSTDPWVRNTDFYVTIPATTQVQINVNSGSLDVHAGSGLTASTGSGIIAMDSIHGPINVTADSGDVTASNTSGPLAITAESGSIRLTQVQGQVKAMTSSGDVIVQNSALSGQSVLQTQNGSVRFLGTIDPRGSYKMDTTSGDVDLTLPGNSAFSLTASTGSGSIQNAFGGNLIGSTPRPPLVLQTQNGSIAITQAA